MAQRPAYTLSKAAAATYFQLLAQETPKEKIQIVTVHPGLVYNDYWKSFGLPAEHFEDREHLALVSSCVQLMWFVADLSAGFAVWITSQEAAFLHGRVVWATWDVTELANGDVRKRIEEDFYFLKESVVGLRDGMLA